MGYLVCDKCYEYYKLQTGESPEDFTDICECGGKLVYYDADSFNPGTGFIDQKPPKITWNNLKKLLLFDMDLEKELKLYGVLFEIFGVIDLLFGVLVVIFIQEQLFFGVLAILIGSSILFVGALPFFFVDKKIYTAYTAVTVALLLQYLILNRTLGLSTWGSAFFFIMIGFFTGKAARISLKK